MTTTTREDAMTDQIVNETALLHEMCVATDRSAALTAAIRFHKGSADFDDPRAVIETATEFLSFLQYGGEV